MYFTKFKGIALVFGLLFLTPYTALAQSDERSEQLAERISSGGEINGVCWSAAGEKHPWVSLEFKGNRYFMFGGAQSKADIIELLKAGDTIKIPLYAVNTYIIIPSQKL